MLPTLYIRPTRSFGCPANSDLNDLKRIIETGNDSAKISALQSILLGVVNGESLFKEEHGGLLMTLIRFILPSKNKTIKKLLLLIFENVEKSDEYGNLKQEFILVW